MFDLAKQLGNHREFNRLFFDWLESRKEIFLVGNDKVQFGDITHLLSGQHSAYENYNK